MQHRRSIASTYCRDDQLAGRLRPATTCLAARGTMGLRFRGPHSGLRKLLLLHTKNARGPTMTSVCCCQQHCIPDTVQNPPCNRHLFLFIYLKGFYFPNYFSNNMQALKKRKIVSENRAYQERWEKEYLVSNNNGKLQCLVCFQTIGVSKEYNVKRHYTTLHESKFKGYTGEARTALVSDLRRKLQQQTGTFTKIPKAQAAALHASYAVSLQLAKAKRPFVDGTLVKQCATEMAKAFEEMKIAEKFETVALSRPTVQRRIEKLGEKVEESLVEDFKECSYFSLCLDESTDETDVSQLIIVARIVQKDFSVREEVFDLCPLHGTTKGSDIYEALKTSVKKLGNWEKCSVIVTDRAPAMLGEKTGLVGLLKKDGITCPTLHCIIYQEALCGKEIKKMKHLKQWSRLSIRFAEETKLCCNAFCASFWTKWTQIMMTCHCTTKYAG